jgi:hypothetical protein
METLKSSMLLTDSQSLENLIDEREQLLEESIEVDKRKAADEAEA